MSQFRMFAQIFFVLFLVLSTFDPASAQSKWDSANWKAAGPKYPFRTNAKGQYIQSADGIWFRFIEKKNAGRASEYVYQFMSQAKGPVQVKWWINYWGADGKERIENLSAKFRKNNSQVYSSGGWRFFAAPGQNLTAVVETKSLNSGTAVSKPGRASFDRTWETSRFDILAGSTLHAKFDIDGLKGRECLMAANFEFSNGQKIKDYDYKDRSQQGNVQVTTTFRPKFDSTNYKDFKLSFDHKTLHLKANKTHNLKFYFVIFVKESGDWKHVASSEKSSFQVEWNGAAHGVTFKSPNYTYRNRKLTGFRLHFDYKGLKDKQCQALVSFRRKSDGSKLSHQLRENFTPTRYDSGVYDDFRVALNKDDLGLWPGKHELEWWVNIYVRNGSEWTHLGGSKAHTITLNIRQNQNQQHLGTVKTRARKVNIVYRDHGSEDFDRVQIRLNGGVVVQNATLRNRTQSVWLTLKNGINNLSFKALNEGNKSPNTAEFEIVDGNGKAIASRREWNLRSGQQAVIAIIKN